MDWDRVEAGNLPARSYDIFISYSRADAKTAHGLRMTLLSEGYRVWWDGELRAGDEFPAEIEQAIRACHWVVCLWSKTAIASDWVRREVSLGRAHSRVIPIKLDDCKIPEEFSDLHTVAFTDWPTCLRELYRAMLDRDDWRQLRERRSFMKHRYRTPLDPVERELEDWTGGLGTDKKEDGET